MKLPRPDPAIIARRPEILRQLQALLPADDLIVDRESLKQVVQHAKQQDYRLVSFIEGLVVSPLFSKR